jgi:phosphoglycolate phosphatase-like HAD superfamily hydrolase
MRDPIHAIFWKDTSDGIRQRLVNGSGFAHLRLAAPQRIELLGNVLARVASIRKERAPVITFDLDGTLMDNRPRVVRILHELGEFWASRHPDASAALRQAHTNGMAYSLIDNLRLLGIEDPKLQEQGLRFWHERFFTDAYLTHDVEVPGAVQFARRCHASGATLVYLTGRDLPNMALGTFASLRDLGFPIGVVGTELVTKPDFDTPDHTFKEEVAAELGRLGEVVAAFDNEPANCNVLRELYPAGVSVLVNTLHAPDPPPLHADVRVIDSFEL